MNRDLLDSNRPQALHLPTTAQNASVQRQRAIQSASMFLILLASAVLSFMLYWHMYLNGSHFHGFTWHRAPWGWSWA